MIDFSHDYILCNERVILTPLKKEDFQHLVYFAEQ